MERTLRRRALHLALVAALAPCLQAARFTRATSRTDVGRDVEALAEEAASESFREMLQGPTGLVFGMTILGAFTTMGLICCLSGGPAAPTGVLPGFVDVEKPNNVTPRTRRSVLFKQAMQADAQSRSPPSSEDDITASRTSGRVSFKGEDEVVKVPSTKGETSRGPAHGHWVPNDILQSRNSFQDADAVRIGGRTVTVAGVDCILVEPQGVVIKSAEYVSTGLVVAFHGEKMSDGVMEEWDKVLKESKILDSAMSLLLPNVTEGSSMGLQSLKNLVKASLDLTDSSSCVLVGKGWGAHRVAELASCPDMADAIAGVVLAAPGGEPPAAAVPTKAGGGLLVPCLLLWSASDRVMPYGGRSSSAWNDALSSANVPLVWKVLRGGGHGLDGMLRLGMSRVGLDLLSFIKVGMMLHWLYQDKNQQTPIPMNRQRSSSSQSTATISDHFPLKMQRLLEELPAYIAEKLGGTRGEDSSDTIEKLLRTEGYETMRARLVAVLEAWIRSGLSPYF